MKAMIRYISDIGEKLYEKYKGCLQRTYMHN